MSTSLPPSPRPLTALCNQDVVFHSVSNMTGRLTWDSSPVHSLSVHAGWTVDSKWVSVVVTRIGTVEPPCAGRRCVTPDGTASPDAGPQEKLVRHSAPLKTPGGVPSGRGSTRHYDSFRGVTSPPPTFSVW